MAKKTKKTPGIDYWKLGLFATSILLAMVLIYLGVTIFTDSGERTFNKYLHALRKMHFAASKPSDLFVAGLTYDEFNKGLIQAVGLMVSASALMILTSRKEAAGVCLVLLGGFMLASKDFIKIESKIAVIEREAKMRPENFCRDLSLIGVGLILIGGMGGNFLGRAYVMPTNEEPDETKSA